MNKTPKSKKNFQVPSLWWFITTFCALVGSSPAFNALVLDFKPNWNSHSGWIKLTYIGFCILPIGAYFVLKIMKKSPSPEKLLDDKFFEREWKKHHRKYLFTIWFFNIITLRVIPLVLCGIISKFFVKKIIFGYWIDSFIIPQSWPNYENIIDNYFKTASRVIIERSDDLDVTQSYEVKFNRDFQNVELRWTDKNDSKFQPPIQGKYENIFSNDKKGIGIFTWITPFGLWWNLVRIVKTTAQKITTEKAGQ